MYDKILPRQKILISPAWKTISFSHLEVCLIVLPIWLRAGPRSKERDMWITGEQPSLAVSALAVWPSAKQVPKYVCLHSLISHCYVLKWLFQLAFFKKAEGH